MGGYFSENSGEIDERMFGKIRCSGCSRTWYSANTWKDYGQECNNCLKKGYPIWRVQARQSDNNEKRLPHDKYKCEKCAEVGFCPKFQSSVKRKPNEEWCGCIGWVFCLIIFVLLFTIINKMFSILKPIKSHHFR